VPSKAALGRPAYSPVLPNQVHNSQTSCFIWVPGQNPGRSSWGDSVVLWLQSVMMMRVHLNMRT